MGISRIAPLRIRGKLGPLGMGVEMSGGRRDDGRLWAIALGLSLIGNLIILALIGVAVFRSYDFTKSRPVPPPPIAEEMTVMIVPPESQPIEKPEALSPAEQAAAEEAAAAPVPKLAPALPEFARTSEEQRGKRPDKPAFMGERDTEATSDRTPDPTAPPLPSQAGVKPRDASDIETTESKYQDGTLEHDEIAKPDMAATEPVPEPIAQEEQPPESKPVESPAMEQNETQKPVPAARENLVEGPNPVEVPVPMDKPEEALKPTPTKPEEETASKSKDEKPKETTKPLTKARTEPGFRGNQRKTAIQGSISRTGRSSLDVVDSPLGRYQATISRAVEQEWQRNCVRHRDFITPGYLTVRFFVKSSGKVSSVQFVGDIETGEVQKGFTLNSIRDADIPAMPPAVRQEFAEEPLELIFNFYF